MTARSAPIPSSIASQTASKAALWPPETTSLGKGASRSRSNGITASVGRRSTISSFAFCRSGGGSGLGSFADDPTRCRAAQEGLGLVRPPLPVAAQSLRERARCLVVQGDAEGGRLDHRQRAHRLGPLGGGEQ